MGVIDQNMDFYIWLKIGVLPFPFHTTYDTYTKKKYHMQSPVQIYNVKWIARAYTHYENNYENPPWYTRYENNYENYPWYTRYENNYENPSWYTRYENNYENYSWYTRYENNYENYPW